MLTSFWNSLKGKKASRRISEPNKGSSYLVQYLVTGIGCLGIFNDGAHFGWASPSLAQLKNATNSSLKITEGRESWIILMQPLGCLTACLILPFLVDGIGRKFSLIITSLGYLVGWILLGFTENIAALYIGRFIAGSSEGITFSVVPIYFGEIISPKIRGTIISCSVLSFWMGPFVINILETYIEASLSAKIFSLLSVVIFICSLFMPESPYFLLMKKKDSKARETLQCLRGTNIIDEDYNRIKEAVHSQVKFKDFFLEEYNRRALLVVVILRLTQQMIGPSAISFYLQEILRKTGYNISPSTTSSIYLAIQNLSSLISLRFADCFGRKPVLILSLTCSGLAIFITGSFFYLRNETQLELSGLSFIPVLALVIYIASFSFGMQQMPLIYLSEVFTPQIKGVAVGICTTAYSAGILVSTEFFHLIESNFSLHYAFFGFAFFALTGLIFVIYYVPETKDKTLEEIQKAF